MENQLLNCLLANLIGLGKQFLPRGQAGLSQEGQAAFFDILSQKMGGTGGASASAIPGFMVDTGDGAAAAETDDTGHGPVAASLGSEDLSILVSSLISAMDSTVVADRLPDMKNAADIEDFLQGILEVLSGGDEIELKIPQMTGTTTVLPGEEDTQADGAESAKQFMGCLASVLLGLDRVTNAGGSEAETVAAATDDLPAPQVEKPDPSVVKTDPQKVVADNVIHEDQEAPVFVVEVVKAAKRDDEDLSRVKDTAARAAAGVLPAEDSSESKDNFLILASRRDTVPKDGVEPEKIVIRVRETENTEVDPSGDNRIIPQNDSSGQHPQQASSEAKGVVKNDFGAAMVDKIEKLTEQYAGKGTNMDMVVKLRINDRETVLVGLREEGNTVTVEVKTANENTMNFIQSQKDDLIKNLENKNIFTRIHVDINQDQQGKQQQQRNDRAREDGDPEEQQDFGAFIEALV